MSKIWSKFTILTNFDRSSTASRTKMVIFLNVHFFWVLFIFDMEPPQGRPKNSKIQLEFSTKIRAEFSIKFYTILIGSWSCQISVKMIKMVIFGRTWGGSRSFWPKMAKKWPICKSGHSWLFLTWNLPKEGKKWPKNSKIRIRIFGQNQLDFRADFFDQIFAWAKICLNLPAFPLAFGRSSSTAAPKSQGESW